MLGQAITVSDLFSNIEGLNYHGSSNKSPRFSYGARYRTPEIQERHRTQWLKELSKALNQACSNANYSKISDDLSEINKKFRRRRSTASENFREQNQYLRYQNKIISEVFQFVSKLLNDDSDEFPGITGVIATIDSKEFKPEENLWDAITGFLDFMDNLIFKTKHSFTVTIEGEEHLVEIPLLHPEVIKSLQKAFAGLARKSSVLLTKFVVHNINRVLQADPTESYYTDLVCDAYREILGNQETKGLLEYLLESKKCDEALSLLHDLVKLSHNYVFTDEVRGQTMGLTKRTSTTASQHLGFDSAKTLGRLLKEVRGESVDGSHDIDGNQGLLTNFFSRANRLIPEKFLPAFKRIENEYKVYLFPDGIPANNPFMRDRSDSIYNDQLLGRLDALNHGLADPYFKRRVVKYKLPGAQSGRSFAGHSKDHPWKKEGREGALANARKRMEDGSASVDDLRLIAEDNARKQKTAKRKKK